jgi:hypothetical protein
MKIAIVGSALRRHPFSSLCTALLTVLSASMFGVSVPLAFLIWCASSALSLPVWRALEPFVLRRLGARAPSRLECERLAAVVHGSSDVEILLVDAPEPWLVRGIGSVVVSRAMLDLLEDRALVGLLAQAAAPMWPATLAGELVVWLGNTPLLCAWWLSRILSQLGRPLAVVVGASLILPLVLWPVGFTRWAGRLFGAAIVGLSGATLLSSGLAGAGCCLLLSWILIPGLQGLLGWEWRRAETAADRATVDAGLGWHLLEALETLGLAEALPGPRGVLGLLRRSGAPVTTRADRLWRELSRS